MGEIGGYRLLGTLGDGGMGTVYKAEQEHPRRTVALKVIKPGVLSAEHLHRFDRETEVLGRLQHPGIAQIYDAGVADDGHTPYFAMEYVAGGRSLTAYAASAGLTVRKRLALLAQVCDAVHHAHQRGIIHRDLKPGNILVDESGQPKVLDFGIARVTDSDIQATMQTDVGQLLGTLPYMSPEQVAADVLDLDTRSDVYALGVILYELLADRLPYEVARRPLTEAVRVITEEEPAALDRTLDADVELIVRKALEKERPRRYQSAADLSADIRRFLADEPIEARAPTTAYQLRKFARRHVALVSGVATAVVALTVGLVATSYFMLDARAERTVADQRRNQAEDLIGFMLGDLREQLEPVGRLDVLDSVGDQALAYFASVSEEELTDDELFRRSTALRQIGEVRLAQGNLPAATEAFEDSLNLARALVERDPDNTEWQSSLGEKHFWVGFSFWEREELDDALEHFRPYLRIHETLLEKNPDNLEVQGLLAMATSTIGSVLEAQGDLAGALEHFRRTLDIDEALAAEDPTNNDRHFSLSLSHNTIGVVLSALGDLDGALAHSRADLAIKERLLAGAPTNTVWLSALAVTHAYLGNQLLRLGNIEEAFAQFEAALAVGAGLTATDPTNTLWQRHLSSAYRQSGGVLLDLDEVPRAQERLSSSRTILEQLLTNEPDSPAFRRLLAAAHVGTGAVSLAMGNLRDAREEAQTALAMTEPLFEGDSENQQTRRWLTLSHLLEGNALSRLGEAEQARAAWTRALDAIEPVARLSADPQFLDPWARSLLHLDRIEEATPVVEKLRTFGYRNPQFLELCRRKGVL